MAMKAILARRFSPLNFSAIEDYPHPVPLIDEWKDLLPRFYEGKDDNPVEHVHEFHALMQQLDIHHEDILMKMFMYSLDGDARKWYFSLPSSSISSLKDFHRVFNEHCKSFYPSESICHNCCEGYVECAQDLLDCSVDYKDENYFIHCPNEDRNEPLSLSYSREESLPDISHDCTNDCMDSFALYHVPYASDVSDSKEEPIVEEDLSLFLQEVSHDIFSPKIEERDRGIVHFSVQDQGALGSPIFDEYSDEEEKIHFADLRSSQPSYDSYESDYDGEQYFEESC
jgi:hypothetical protein